MVQRPDGGGGSGGPTGVGYKLDLKVESLRVLADQIADDLKDFDGQFDSWNQQRNYSHPLSAQYSSKEGGGGVGAIFEEANDLHVANKGSHLQVEIGVQLLRKGLEALHQAADNLAKTYKSLDEANALGVAQVQWLFPEPKKPTGGGGRELPTPEQMQKALRSDGFDLDGDGVVDPSKGDILFAPTSGKKPEFTGRTSKNDTPDDTRPEVREDYSMPVDENAPSEEAGGFSDEVREEYAEQMADEPVIMAPGDWGADSGSQGTPSGTATA